jgi:hypothetical protein
MTPEEICREYNIPFRQAGEDNNVREGFIGLHCPYCGRPDDKFYLGWNLARRFMSCWSCGFIPAAKALAELAGIPFGKARSLLGEMEPAEWETDRAALRGRYVEPPRVTTMLMPHHKYLQGRGLNSEQVERLWGVGGIGIAERLQWRLFIPILYRGERVSWTTRTIGTGEPRYISAPAECERISAKQILYGGDYVRHTAIVCEGPFDVWAVGPGAVGLSGIGFSAAQVLALSKIPNRVVCFDAEPAAQLRARQLVDQLAPFNGRTWNAVLDAKDPAAAGEKEIRALRKFLE